MIPVNTPLLEGNEKQYLSECIDSGWISSEGAFVKRLETHFETLCHRRHAVAVCNGSAALDLALACIGLEPGDEVILPSFTIISCVQAILRIGAVPVVVDCDERTWTMNVSDIEQAVTARTKAIMAVHIYGLPCDMDPLLDLAARHKLQVIEDAAEAHGLDYKGRPCGSFGAVSTFSFYPNKLVTTGEGGMILTDDDRIATRLRSSRNLCFQAHERFVHEELGWNMRMSNLQAAVGCAQFERLGHFIERKRRMGLRYDEALRAMPLLQLPCRATAHAENIYWVFGMVLKLECSLDARQVMSLLAAEGIGTRPFFWPLHQQPVLKRMGLFEGVSLPQSERLARRGFYVPSGLGLTDGEQDRVVSALRRVLEKA